MGRTGKRQGPRFCDGSSGFHGEGPRWCSDLTGGRRTGSAIQQTGGAPTTARPKGHLTQPPFNTSQGQAKATWGAGPPRSLQGHCSDLPVTSLPSQSLGYCSNPGPMLPIKDKCQTQKLSFKRLAICDERSKNRMDWRMTGWSWLASGEAGLVPGTIQICPQGAFYGKTCKEATTIKCGNTRVQGRVEGGSQGRGRGRRAARGGAHNDRAGLIRTHVTEKGMVLRGFQAWRSHY